MSIYSGLQMVDTHTDTHTHKVSTISYPSCACVLSVNEGTDVQYARRVISVHIHTALLVWTSYQLTEAVSHERQLFIKNLQIRNVENLGWIRLVGSICGINLKRSEQTLKTTAHKVSTPRACMHRALMKHTCTIQELSMKHSIISVILCGYLFPIK